VEFAREHAAGREVQWDDLYEFVDEAVDELPDKLRVPLVAHFLEGETQADIARMVHTPRPTVTNRIHKGIEIVRRSLRKRGIEVAAPAPGRGGDLHQVVAPVDPQDLLRVGGARSSSIDLGAEVVERGADRLQPLGPLGVSGRASVVLIARIFDD